MYASLGGARTFTALLAFSFLTSCAVMNPHRNVSKDEDTYKTNPTMKNAFLYANGLRREYRDGIKDHYYLNSGVGITLISMTSVAAFLGAISKGSTAIPALAAGGAGLYGASKLATNVDHQMIYAVGANAVSCVLATYEPLFAQIEGAKVDTAGRNDRLTVVANDIVDLSTKAAAVREKVATRLKPTGLDNQDKLPSADSSVYADFLNRLKAAEQSTVRAQAALDIAYRAPGRLMADIQSVQAAVDIALIKSTPNIEDVLTVMGTAVPSFSKIPPKMEAKKESTVSQSRSGDDLVIDSDLASVEVIASRLEIFSKSVVEPVSADIVEKCAAGLDKAAARLTVTPEDTIELSATAGARGDARISGGKPPYAPPRWFGVVPAETALELRSDISGVVSVIVKDPAKAPGSYTVGVSDLGGNTVSFAVSVAAASGGASAPSPSPQTPSPTALSPPKQQVETFQKFLIEKQCLPATRKDGKSNADGDWGQCTTNAVAKLEVAARGTKANSKCQVSLVGLDNGWMSRNGNKSNELTACLQEAQCAEPISTPEDCKGL